MRVLGLLIVMSSAGVWAQPVCLPASQCSCTNTACSCTGAGCQFHCDGATCGISAPAVPAAISCEDVSRCAIQVGGASTMDCGETATCTGTFGAGSALACGAKASCQVTVGDQSSVTCNGPPSSCVVVCTQRCLVSFSGAAGAPSCTGPDALSACGGGLFACGACAEDTRLDGGRADGEQADAGGAPDAGTRPSDADAGAVELLRVQRELKVGAGCATMPGALWLAGLGLLGLPGRRSRP